MKRRPILTMEEFERAHIEQREQLLRYAISGRGRHVIGDDLWADLRDADAGSLKATSARSRIAFARAVRLRLARHLERVDGPFSLITLCPPEFAMPLSKAVGFDAEALIGWAMEALNSASFIAVIEAALYTNRSLRGTQEPTVSWHVHAITWNILIAELEARFATINKLQVGFIPGLMVADALPLSKPDALARTSYMLKAPLSEYRVYRLRRNISMWQRGRSPRSRRSSSNSGSAPFGLPMPVA